MLHVLLHRPTSPSRRRCLRPGRSHGPTPGAPHSPGKTWPRLTLHAGEGTPRCSHLTTTLRLPPPKAHSRTRGTSQARRGHVAGEAVHASPSPCTVPWPRRGSRCRNPSPRSAPHQALAWAGFPRGAATPRRCRLAPLHAACSGKPRHRHASAGTSPPPVPQSHGAGSLPDPGANFGWMRLEPALTVTQSPRHDAGHRVGKRLAGTNPCSTSGTPCACSATSPPRTGAAFPSPVPGLGGAGSRQNGDHLPAPRDGWGRVFWRHLLPRRLRQRGG